MTDYRQQAIEDVARAGPYDVHKVEWMLSGSFNPNPLITNVVLYAVAQREARLRLEDALDKIKLLAEASELGGDSIPAVTSRTLLPLIRAALEAVKEKP